MASTAEIVRKIRLLMKDVKYVPEPLQAYIVPSTDAHNSEYIGPRDKRRTYVSGFTGSAGTAVILEDKALLWVDGRYHIQADKETDPKVWTVIKEGLPKMLSMPTWFARNLPPKSKIGVDPMLISTLSWNELLKKIIPAGHTLVEVPTNLVDCVWEDQPPRPAHEVHVHPLKFSGKPWSEKVQSVRDKMKEAGAEVLIVSELDQIAWLFNLRGRDVTYNPVFMAFAAVALDSTHIFIDEKKLSSPVRAHLTTPNEECVAPAFVHPYDSVRDYVAQQVQHGKKLLIANTSSAALTSIVPNTQLIMTASPIAELKAIKNETELKGMRQCHIRDATALVQFFAWLEERLQSGREITEVSAATKAEELRRMQDLFVDLSFESISAAGPNAALPHYRPNPDKDVCIRKDQIYLLDSGGQYSDGTTDITRTVHFGTPTDFQKETFTRVLKGHIGLARAIFPKKTKGISLDSFARMHLWAVGLDYGHGTGHGVGSFLNVHEGPVGISRRHLPADPGLQEGMILSNEPGFYEEGSFGIRIENLVEVVKVTTPYNHEGKSYLSFETISLVPIQLSLIDPSLLTKEEIDWLNEYHMKVRESVGPLLREARDDRALEWLERETRPLG